jgi:ribonuclease HII
MPRPPFDPSQLTSAELRRRFLDEGEPLSDQALSALDSDRRLGVRRLAVALRTKRRSDRAEARRLRNLLRFETELWDSGIDLVAGVDEAGVAPLAGPVVAGAVILHRGYRLRGLDDSKKILDEVRRDDLAQCIKRDAVAWSVGVAGVEEIDSLNVYHAGLLAMRRAVEGLSKPPDYVLVDARRIPGLTVPQRGIIKGDALSATIAAASILAKTTRDAMMRAFDDAYPGYGLAAHKGYPTPAHLEALRRLGALPIHRRSFAPVREALRLDPVQESLFGPVDEQDATTAPGR